MSMTLLQATTQTLQVQTSRLTDQEDVQYYIEIALGEDTIGNSGWLDEDPNDDVNGPSYLFDSLEPETTYQFRFKARDTSAPNLETNWSEWFAFTTLPVGDITAPTPDPMTFETTAVDANNLYDGRPRVVPFTTYTISMQATVATDPEGTAVQYEFQCPQSPNLNSGWIDTVTYTVHSNLNPISYGLTFRVRARDANGNVTQWSEAVPVSDGYPPG